MADLHILIWALSLLFCMAMGFVILLWCRSWRREEHEVTERSLETLSREISRLAVAVDGMDETAASLLSADEQLSEDIERLRDQVRLLRSATSSSSRQRPAPSAESPDEPETEQPAPPLEAPEPTAGEPHPETGGGHPPQDRFEEARRLLRQGSSELDVARELQMGAAEVRMIARMLDRPAETGGSPQ